MDTMTFLYCHHNKSPNTLEDEYFILSLDRISLKNKQTSISHNKFTHLAQNYVGLNQIFDKFYEKTELSGLICENSTNNNGERSSYNFEKYPSVINPPMQLMIFL